MDFFTSMWNILIIISEVNAMKILENKTTAVCSKRASHFKGILKGKASLGDNGYFPRARASKKHC